MSKLMTAEQVETIFTKKWGRRAYLNLYRICGNRSAYAVVDGENWHDVEPVWVNGQLFFRL